SPPASPPRAAPLPYTTLFRSSGNGAIVDWVLVELRDATQPTMVLATRSALITRDGRVLGADGAPVLIAAPHGGYHVALRHRNHLDRKSTRLNSSHVKTSYAVF